MRLQQILCLLRRVVQAEKLNGEFVYLHSLFSGEKTYRSAK